MIEEWIPKSAVIEPKKAQTDKPAAIKKAEDVKKQMIANKKTLN